MMLFGGVILGLIIVIIVMILAFLGMYYSNREKMTLPAVQPMNPTLLALHDGSRYPRDWDVVRCSRT